MDDALLSRVIDLLADSAMAAEVEELVLSACQGSEELTTVVEGRPSTDSRPPASSDNATLDASATACSKLPT